MKDFKDFKKFMNTDGAIVHDEIVAEVNRIVKKADIKDPVEGNVFYYRTFSEISVMKILEKYHDWVNKE